MKLNGCLVASRSIIFVTCLSCYFPESVCTAVYGVGYSLFYSWQNMHYYSVCTLHDQHQSVVLVLYTIGIYMYIQSSAISRNQALPRRVRGCKGHRCSKGESLGTTLRLNAYATQRIRETRALDRACAAGHAPCVRPGSHWKAEQAARQRHHATIWKLQ